MEQNIAEAIMTSERRTLPQQPSQAQNSSAVVKKSFFGSAAPAVKVKSNASSFFGQSQNSSRAPSPPFSYISSDSSCDSNDSLILSGESAEGPLPSVSSGIALTTPLTVTEVTEGTNDDTSVRASSPHAASTAEPAHAQRLDKVTKQLFSSPTATSTGKAVTKKPKSTAGAGALVPPRPSTAPSLFFNSTAPPKFVASKVSVPSFSTLSSTTFTPIFGSGFGSKKTATATAADVAGSVKPPLFHSSVPSQQKQQQQSATAKSKVKPKSKNVTFQMGTKNMKPAITTTAAAEEETANTQRDDGVEQMVPVAALSVGPALSAEPSSGLDVHTSPTGTGPATTNFAPVTPASHNNSNKTGVSDRAVLHQVTPDTTTTTTTSHYHRTQDYSEVNGDSAGAVTVSPAAAGASRTVSADEVDDGRDSAGYYLAEHTAESTSVAVDGTIPTTPIATTSDSYSASAPVTTTTFSLDSATQALSLCEQMDQQAEELKDRLRRVRDSVQESRTAMVQQIHSAARIHSQ